MNIFALELDFSQIYRIAESPFEAGAFANVEILTLKDLCPCELKRIAFRGLNSLKSLIFTNIRFDDISDIEIGVLELVKGTLEIFELIEWNNQNQEISINNFIGDNSADLSYIKQVNIRYKLNSINQLSFTAIANVKELDLSECQITNIGEFAFDSLGDNLQLLNLEKNMLVTLPIGIFSTLNLTPMSDEPLLIIRLNQNPWDCDCGFEHLRQLLVDNSNFVGAVLCNTSELIGLECPIVTDAPNTTLPTTTPTTTPCLANPTTENNADENTSPSNGTTEFFTDTSGNVTFLKL